jgi:putative ABC transport system substrate-binding protein
MDRRAFISGITFGLLAAALAAEAQQTGRSHRIGILGNVPPTEPYGALLWGAFIQGLRDHGYTEGQNISIEHLYSEGKYERLVGLADELVRRRVEVIVVPADQNALAARQATRTIPIVMIGDPVGSGLVASLARPEGTSPASPASSARRSSASSWSCSRRPSPSCPVSPSFGIRGTLCTRSW